MTVVAPLLASDPRLPHRDVLLDDAVMARRLSVLLGAADDGPAAVTRVRVKYRVGQSLRALHRVRVGEVDHLVSTRMAPPDRVARLVASSGARPAVKGQRPAVVHDAELDAVSWVFPHDRKIAGLDVLAVPTSRLPALFGRASCTPELVAYAPEKSATARCVDAGGEVLGYAKVYADAEAMCEAIVRAAAAAPLARATRARVPRVLGVVAERHLIAFEAIPGRRLDELAGDDLATGVAGLGHALAALHRLPGERIPAMLRFSPDRLQRAGALVATARPDLGEVANGLAGTLVTSAPSPGTALLHGDVHLKNALLDGDRLGLVDLDQARAGRPAADLGSLLAALRHARLVGTIAPDDERTLRARFLDGYGDHASVDVDDLRWHTAAALLAERALRAVNRVLPVSLGCLPAVLAEAADLAEGRQQP